MSAIRGKAEVARTSPNRLEWPNSDLDQHLMLQRRSRSAPLAASASERTDRTILKALNGAALHWPTAKKEEMNNALVKQVVAKPRMPKRPSASVANTGTTYRATKAQTLLLRAIDKRAEAAAAKKAKAAEEKKARTDKKAEEAASLAHRKATAAHDRLNGKLK